MKAIASDGAGACLLTQVPDPGQPEANQVLIAHEYVGIHHADLHTMRSVDCHSGTILGTNGVGTILKLGSQVQGYTIGQRVGYLYQAPGAFCTHRLVPADRLFAIPDEIPAVIGAALGVPGLSAHFLALRAYLIRRNAPILVRGATGNVGHLLGQWCRSLGAKGIALVSTEEKKQRALEFGYRAAFLHSEPELGARIREAVQEPLGPYAVIDLIGGNDAYSLLPILSPLGMFLSVGECGGALPPLDPALLSLRSQTFSRPRLSIYGSVRIDMILNVQDVFTGYQQKALAPCYTVHAFDDIPQALNQIAQRTVIGTLIAKV